MSSLFKAILDGRLRSGDRLVEEDIAREMGVSRSPLRRALHEMGRANVVVVQPRRGAEVAKWTPDDVGDLWQVRLLVEGLAAEQAAVRGSSDDIDRLAGLAYACSEAYAASRLATAIDLDMAFHTGIMAASKNKFLVNVYGSVAPAIRMFMIAEKRLYPSEEPGISIAEVHVSIHKALSSRDPVQARKLMEAHIRKSAQGLVARMNPGSRGEKENVFPLVTADTAAA